MKLFKSEEKLAPEYVPAKLPHREEELAILRTFFSTFIEKGKGVAVRVMLVGPVGVGKTALSRRFGALAEEEAASRGVTLRYVHVNCKLHPSLFSILRRVIESLKALLPTRGLSNEELLHNLLRYISEKKISLVVGLDEVDGLIREESDALYFLSRIGEERPDENRLSLIMTIRSVETLGLLDESIRSMLQNNVIYLNEYSAKQLHDILSYRASEAFYDGVVDDDVINLIVDASAQRGDARYAIEILWRAGKYAENEGASKVMPEHVRRATASIYPAIKRESLSYLSLHEKLILLAATRLFSSSEKTQVTSSELNSAYRVVCEEYGVVPRAYTRFWEYLQRLEDLGILRIRVSSEGSRGRRSYLTLPEIPVSILNRELTALIESESRRESRGKLS